jgi:hypothetical protein
MSLPNRGTSAPTFNSRLGSLVFAMAYSDCNSCSPSGTPQPVTASQPARA